MFSLLFRPIVLLVSSMVGGLSVRRGRRISGILALPGLRDGMRWFSEEDLVLSFLAFNCRPDLARGSLTNGLSQIWAFGPVEEMQPPLWSIFGRVDDVDQSFEAVSKLFQMRQSLLFQLVIRKILFDRSNQLFHKDWVFTDLVVVLHERVLPVSVDVIHQRRLWFE